MERRTGNSAIECHCQRCKYLRLHRKLKRKKTPCLGFLALVSGSQKFFGRTGPTSALRHRQKRQPPHINYSFWQAGGEQSDVAHTAPLFVKAPSRWKGYISAASAHETSLILILHTHYRDAHTDTEERDKARITDGCAPQRTSQCCFLSATDYEDAFCTDLFHFLLVPCRTVYR